MFSEYDAMYQSFGGNSFLHLLGRRGIKVSLRLSCTLRVDEHTSPEIFVTVYQSPWRRNVEKWVVI